MTEQNVRQGRRNQSAGKRWQQDCAAWLRANGWPSAGYEIRNRHNDLIGTWDLGVECTIDGWDDVPAKLEKQATEDAARRGLSLACLWKKRNRKDDPGKGLVLMVAEVFFPMVQRLERLEQASLEADEQFTRGFTAGIDYGRKHPAREWEVM